MTKKNVNLPVMRRELSIAPAVEGQADNVFTAVYTTGASVRRWDWDEGPYEEVLSLDDGHIRTERLDAQIVPILLDHNATVRNQVGVIERHWVEGGKGYIQFRMETGTEQAEAILNKIRQGIVKTMSVGYRVWKFLKSTSQGKLPVLRAVDWEPFEVSFVSVPADAGAVIRSEGETVACVLETETETTSRSAEMPAPVIEDTNKAPDAQPLEATRAAEIQTATAAAVRSALEIERKRTTGITELVRSFGLADTLADTMIGEGKTIDQARELVLSELAKTQTETRSSVGHSYDDPAVVRAALVDSLAAKVDPTIKVEGKATEFRGLSMGEGYAEVIEARGERAPRGKVKLAERAMQGNSDFPVILAEALNRVVRNQYEAATPSYKMIAQQVPFSDFRATEFMRSGEFPPLKPLTEHGEVQYASLGDASTESLKLSTEGIILGLTREVLINDHLGIIAQTTQNYGRRVAATENQKAYAVLKDNANMKDGTPLFHASRKNLHGSVVAVPDLATLSKMRATLKQHKSDGVPLNFSLKYILSPTELETDFEKLMSAVLATTTGDVNVFSGKFQIICDAELDSHNAWYGAASPGQGGEVLAYGYLNGASGPEVRTREGWSVLGGEIRLIHDFAVGPIGAKPIYKVKTA